MGAFDAVFLMVLGMGVVGDEDERVLKGVFCFLDCYDWRERKASTSIMHWLGKV